VILSWDMIYATLECCETFTGDDNICEDLFTSTVRLSLHKRPPLQILIQTPPAVELELRLSIQKETRKAAELLP